MKRTLSIILSVIMVFALLPISVMAENGPSDAKEDDNYLAYISVGRVINLGDGAVSFGDSNDVYRNDTAIDSDGISYDKASNTLTLTNFKQEDKIIITNMMGDDFKINVVGECEVARMNIWGDGYGGTLNIVGTGKLTVNKNKLFDNAIVLYAESTESTLNFGENVNVKLYAKENVAVIKEATYNDKSKAFRFANGSSADVQGEIYAYTDYKRIDGCHYDDTNENFGKKVIRASDPDGIYIANHYIYYDENEEETGTGYGIQKLEYIEEYGTYERDQTFGENGELRMTDEEFENSEYSYVLQDSEYGEKIYYFDGDNEYYAHKAIRKSDPENLYGYVEHDDYDEETGESSFNGNYGIRRFVTDKETGKLVEDETFGSYGYLVLSSEEFEEQYTIVYEKEPTWLKWQGNIVYDYCKVYKDSKGKEYAVDWDDNVYNFSESEKITLSGKEYYKLTLNPNVSVSDLKLVEITQESEYFYNYTLKGKEFNYDGSNIVELQNINFVDIGDVWKTLKYNETVPFTAEVNPNSDCVKKMELVKEYWTNTSDNSVYSTADTTAKKLTEGKYEYTAVLKAKDGYLFGEDFKFVYGGTEFSAGSFSYRITGDRKTLIISEFIDPITVTHSHKLVTKNAKNATYFVKGYTGDKVCSVCRKTVTKGKAIAKLTLKTPKITVKAGKKSFKVKYTKVTGATGFRLRYKLNGKWIVKNYNTKKTVTKIIKKLKKGEKYTVQIRAFVKSGKKMAYSSWTGTKKVTIK